MRIATGGLAAALSCCLSLSAHADDAMKGMDHGSMSHGSEASSSDSPSTEAYRKADMAMHQAMQQTYTGDADKDFIVGMIPHHQGAVDMAKIVLRYGKDPEVRRLARQIVDSQEREIAEMQAMKKRLGAQ